MRSPTTLHRLAIGVGAALLLLASAVGPVGAANTVTAEITGGGLTASIASVTLEPSAFQDAAHHVIGALSLSAADATDLRLGWHVTVQSSAWAYTGAAAGGTLNDIPAAAFSLTSADLPVAVTGQPSDTTAFPAAGRVVPVALDSARSVVSATAAYGAGSYTEALGVDLMIPAGAHVGTYVATLTVTIVVGA